MSLRVVVTEQAEREMQSAYDWWAKNRSKQQADRWYVGIAKAIPSSVVRSQRVTAPESPYESVVFTSPSCLDMLPFRPGKVDGVLWKPLQVHHDGRGWLCELFRHDEMPADMQPAMGYLSQTL